MISTVIIEEQVPFETVYILQLIGFSAGATGCILLPIAVHHSDWRLWLTKNTSHYMSGVTRVGIWKICFPPNLIESDNYTLRCCHDFELFETFFPVEMKVAQIFMFIGSLLAFWGLLFGFLLPLNVFFQRHIHTIWLPFVGGTFYVFSSICVLIPISWNVCSVLRNENIPFPSSFHLPPRPIVQKNGGAIYLGFMSCVLLLVSGCSIIIQVTLMKKIAVAFRSARISSE